MISPSNLPFSGLLQRLEREGFTFGVDAYLEVQTVLRAYGEACLHDPGQLKLLLGPILARNQEHQAIFYEVFDEYYEKDVLPAIQHRLREVEEPVVVVEEAVKRFTYPKWLVPVVVGVALLLGGGMIAFDLLAGADDTPPSFRLESSYGSSINPEIPDTVNVRKTLDIVDIEEGLGAEDERFRKNPYVYILDYGDGKRDTLSSVEDASFQYVYQEVGIYYLSLIKLRQGELGKADARQLVATRQLVVRCPDALEVVFTPSPVAPTTNDEITFGSEVRAGTTGANHYVWIFGDGTKSNEAHPVHQFQKAGSYTVSLRVSRDLPGQFGCGDTALYTQTINVTTPAKEVTLVRQEMSLDNSSEVEHHLTGLGIFFLAGLITMLCLIVGLLLRWLSYRKLSEERKQKFTPGKEGPFKIPLPSQDHYLSKDLALYELARGMRQREESERQRLDLPASIRATLRGGGMPLLKYSTTSKASEYLVLIEQHLPESHLTKLYDRTLQQLLGEDVLLRQYHYDSDPRTCWNDDDPDGVPLETLRQRYPKHRLIVFSDGHSFIDPFEARLQDWVQPLLQVWEGKAALLTDVPVADWGYRERLLSRFFTVQPVDMDGQMAMLQRLRGEQDKDFEEWTAYLKSAIPHTNNSLKDYDFEQIEDLKTYLGPRHLRWLAATMVYPIPTWEVTLAMAHALDQADGPLIQATDPLLTYPNLLHLSRIPWMQNGILPPRLRLALLDTLDEQTELLARKTVLDLLGQVDMNTDSHAAHKAAIHSVTQQFLLTPGDKEIAREMHHLMEEGLVDTPTMRQLDKPREQMRGNSAREYLNNRFARIRPVEVLWGSILAVLLFGTLSAGMFFKQRFTLTQKVVDKVVSLPMIENSFIVRNILRQDSAVIYHNAGVNAYLKEDFQGAVDSLSAAITYRATTQNSAYPLAQYHLGLINYNEGVVAYDEGEYAGAVVAFSVVDLGDAEDSLLTQLSLDTWHGLGLSNYYLELPAEAETYLGLIEQRDTMYFATFGDPNLKTLLRTGQKTDFNYFFDQAYGYFKQQQYDLCITACDSALAYNAASIEIRELKGEAQKQLALLNPEESQNTVLREADALFAKGEYEKALRFYQQALQRNPTDTAVEDKIWVIENCKTGDCPLVEFTFIGPAIYGTAYAHRDFAPLLRRIHTYATQTEPGNELQITISVAFGEAKKGIGAATASRSPNSEKPFYTGSAISFLSIEGNGGKTDKEGIFSAIEGYSNLSEKTPAIQQFFKAIENDPNLTWEFTGNQIQIRAVYTTYDYNKRFEEIQRGLKLCRDDIKRETLEKTESPSTGQDLIAEYSFDGNANDRSGKGLDGKPYGVSPTKGRTGKPDQAYHFDGKTDYVFVPRESKRTRKSAAKDTDHTIAMWIRPTASRDAQLLNVSSYAKLPDNLGIWIQIFTQKGDQGIRYGLNSSGSTWETVESNSTLAPNKWVHVACVKEGRTARIYLDGKLDKTFDMSRSIGATRTSQGDINIGRFWARSQDDFYQGDIDEITIWGRPLSEAEIKSAMGAAAVQPMTTNQQTLLPNESDNGDGTYTMILYPTADASTDRTYASRNYGKKDDLVVSPRGTTNIPQKKPYKGKGGPKPPTPDEDGGPPEAYNYTFMRFDLGELPNGAQVEACALRMTAYKGFAYGGDGNVYIQWVPRQWAESKINWDNQPEPIATRENPIKAWHAWYNNTPAVKNVETADPQLLAKVRSSMNTKGPSELNFRLNSPGYRTHYYSREHQDANERPQLVITYKRP